MKFKFLIFLFHTSSLIFKKKWSLLLCIYISDRTVVGLQILARRDVIILVMRGLDNLSGDFVRVMVCPSGKADLFQQELRPAQEKRRAFLSCGICHYHNVNVQIGPSETFLGSQLPNCKLNSAQEQSCPAVLTRESAGFAGERQKKKQKKTSSVRKEWHKYSPKMRLVPHPFTSCITCTQE